MDGSKTLFAARLNSGLLNQIKGYSIYPGASLTVMDWEFVPLCHLEHEPILNRVVMSIKGFSWTPAPSINTFAQPEFESSDEWTTDMFQNKSILDLDLVCDVEKNKFIRMYNWCKNRKVTLHYSCLVETGVLYGYWIHHEETKRLWKKQLNDRKQEAAALATGGADNEEGSKCTYKDNYDLRQSVLVTFRIGQVCKQDIYDQVVEMIGTDNICSSEFDGFLPNHKHWSLYWYYSVNE
jgi:hypothetical protein